MSSANTNDQSALIKIALAILFQARDDARRGDAEAADFLKHSDLAEDLRDLLGAGGLHGEIELGTLLRRQLRPRAVSSPRAQSE